MASITGGIQQLAQDNPKLYYGACIGYVALTPIVAIARSALIAYQYFTLPSQALFDKAKNDNRISALTAYRDLEGAKDFLKGQAIRAVIELFSWFAGAFVLLLRDLAYRIYHPDEEGSESPAAVVHRLNEALYREVEPDQFVTLFYGLLNLQDGTFNYVNAGHPPPFICNPATHTCRQLAETNLILGALPVFKYIEGQESVDRGETLVLFTDGVIETRNHKGQVFGEEGLAKVLVNIIDSGADQARSVFEACREFGGGEITDDFACVMIKRLR